MRIKICGLTRADDLDAAMAAGADAVGLNFYLTSPRQAPARDLQSRLPPVVEPVGVFVRLSLPEVRARLDEVGRVRVAQVHGGPAEACAEPPAAHVPAFQVGQCENLDAIEAYLGACRAEGELLATVLGHARLPPPALPAVR